MDYKQNRNSYWGLLGSVLFHFVTALSLFFYRPQKGELPHLVTLDLLEKPDESLTKKVDETEKKQRIVEQKVKINDESPEKTEFLSDHNQKVIKQTSAKEKSFNPNPTIAIANHRDSFFEKVTPEYKISQNMGLTDLEKSADGLKQNLEKEKKRQPASGGTNVEYIKELDPGLETMLSTREFVFYTYYARIRQQLNMHWQPKVRSKITKLYREGRSIASTDDKVTKCLVTLDAKGNLLRVQIIGKSGLRELDEAATESFREAAPFPNPPKGIIEKDNTIRIRWDFILEA